MRRKRVIRAGLRLLALITAAAALWACAPGGAARDIAPESSPGCEDGTQPSGAAYRICMPQAPVEWNGGLVVYAHGYVAPTRPPGLPEEQFVLPDGTGVDELATGLGYAFAASGYRRNGLAVQEGVEDSLELVEVFAALKGEPERVFIAGVSEGGLVATLALERHPAVFDGGMALCGPIGDFRRQTTYFTDFRVVFDYFFPGLIPPTAVEIPSDLLDTWETSTYSTTVKPVVTNPANASALDQLLAVTGAPVDPLDAATREQTVERLLWYNVYATNDAREQLGGNPFDNSTHTYVGSLDDAALNAGVARFTGSITATTAISAAYQTGGRLFDPLITMHTSGDPVVPTWHQSLYGGKAQAQGSAALLEQYTFARYGHCSVQQTELVALFRRLAEIAADPGNHREPPVLLPLVSR
jgi:pimeloyl-ACP methyl ester carboxylesterase